MNSCIYRGIVTHRRWKPLQHSFSYRVFQLYLDLAELDAVFERRWLWSTDRPNVAWFRRSDHLGDPHLPLDQSVRELVKDETDQELDGPIRLLTHPRYFGYVMNPVSFYFCFDAADRGVRTIVAEVHNTPWGERHCYVLNTERDNCARGGSTFRFRFPKTFHVSPFMPMNQIYDWRFTLPASHLSVVTNNVEADERIFGAIMRLERRPLDRRQLRSALMTHPFMTAKVIAGIYWQAFRLWLKGCRSYSHPKWTQAKDVSA